MLQINWMRAARTDKGVSAVGQIVSLKMIVGFADYDLIGNINKHLPAQIRVLGYTKTTAGFDARKHCDKRRYEYVLPVWAFDPNSCRGRIDVEQAELGQAAHFIVTDADLPNQSRNDDSGAAAAQAAVAEASAIAVASQAALPVPASSSSLTQLPAGEPAGPGALEDLDLPQPKPAEALAQVTSSDNLDARPGSAQASKSGGLSQDGPALAAQLSEHTACDSASASALQDASIQGISERPAPAPAHDPDQPCSSGFVFDDIAMQRLSIILKQYEGTHNFHNFTIRLDANDPCAKRYMLSCKCTGVFDIQVPQLEHLLLQLCRLSHVPPSWKQATTPCQLSSMLL